MSARSGTPGAGRRGSIRRVVSAALAAVAVAGCGSGSGTTAPPGPVAITAINVTAPSSTVIVTSTLQLSAAAQPIGASSAVTWSTSDASLATIDAAGLVTGLRHGTVTITATSSANAAVKGTLVITVAGCPTPRPLAATINSATTLQNWILEPACFDYSAAATVTVSNALLTVEAGVAVGFAAGRLLITNTAGLQAAGTATDPIRLSGTTATRGSWDGVMLQGTTHPSNRLEHVTIEHGGGRSYGGGIQPANLALELGARTTMVSLTLRESAGFGIHMNPQSVVAGAGYLGGAITRNTSGPGYVVASVTHYLAGTATPPLLTGNDRDVLDVVPNAVTGTVAWRPIGIPYRIVQVSSREAFNVTGDMTLTGPLTILFDEDMAMNVSSGGRLSVTGTAQAPVLLTATDKENGFWRGLRVEDATAEIDGMIVEYGGRVGGTALYQPANVQLRTGAAGTSALTLRNSILRRSANYGFSTRSVKSDLVQFTNNTLMTNRAGPAYVSSSHVDRMLATNQYTGNGNDVVTVSIESSDITTDATWRDLGVPYHLIPGAGRRTLLVEGVSLTIEPGVDIRFDPGMGIQINDGGSLVAQGTMQNRITLGAASSNWRGINVHQSTAAFDYLDFSNAGSSAWSVEARPASVTVTTAGGANSLAVFTPRVTTTGASFGVAFGYGPTIARACLAPIYVPPPDQVSDHCQP